MNTGQESTNDILTEISSLSTNHINKSKKTITGNKDDTSDPDGQIKTYSVEDIMDKKINKLESFLDSKVINIYQRPWNKLETKLKLNKIQHYIKDLAETGTETESGTDTNNLSFDYIKKLLTGLNADKKKVKVEYDQESCKIISLKIV